ncbi:MAG TPA: hypothetical protein VGN95_07300 [Pyrinomonadaceae bacterium]|nr:hypothetical protein [Pyrinomonadaceae bacterium]
MPVRKILLSTFLLMLTISVGGVWAHEAKDAAMTSTHANAPLAFRPVIEFGHQGGNLRPYKIGIDASGRVRVLQGRTQLATNHIPAEKVQELVSMASDKSFWESSSADDAETKRGLPDFGFVFVRVRAAAGSQPVIYHHGRQTGPLGKFYAQLSDLVLAHP